ncbi:hypothetical protein EDB19DRAFT_1970334 [Suillus lakei]|nr:hypothetical protein EDB19DRAFT_1970334 [Suillus lakei]
MMLEKFAIAGVGILHEVVNWPAGVPPMCSDFIFKDLKTNELKALVGPYLKFCMGTEYHMELAHVKHLELKKKRKDKSSGVKVPEKELMFVPWSDKSKELMNNEDSDMLNIPLITNMKGNVQHTLMDCILFMKNLPPNIEALDSAYITVIYLRIIQVNGRT